MDPKEQARQERLQNAINAVHWCMQDYPNGSVEQAHLQGIMQGLQELKDGTTQQPAQPPQG